MTGSLLLSQLSSRSHGPHFGGMGTELLEDEEEELLLELLEEEEVDELELLELLELDEDDELGGGLDEEEELLLEELDDEEEDELELGGGGGLDDDELLLLDDEEEDEEEEDMGGDGKRSQRGKGTSDASEAVNFTEWRRRREIEAPVPHRCGRQKARARNFRPPQSDGP